MLTHPMSKAVCYVGTPHAYLSGVEHIIKTSVCVKPQITCFAHLIVQYLSVHVAHVVPVFYRRL